MTNVKPVTRASALHLGVHGRPHRLGQPICSGVDEQVFEQQSTAGLTLLIGTHPTDAATYIGVATTLVLVAIAACLMPARRAATVNPIVALRAQ